jgi:hypothetical protein
VAESKVRSICRPSFENFAVCNVGASGGTVVLRTYIVAVAFEKLPEGSANARIV